MNAYCLQHSGGVAVLTRQRPSPLTIKAVFLDTSPTRPLEDHERGTFEDLTARLAALQGFSYGGSHAPTTPPGRGLYFVPRDTLTAAAAQSLRITRASHLFGGVVPHAVFATSAIAHSLVPGAIDAPPGWREALPARVAGVVLPGYAAFSRKDARSATLRLFVDGPVRLKPCTGTGGRGQTVVRDEREFDAWLDSVSDETLATSGVVCEIDLARQTTLEVGQVDLGPRRISYCGVQRQTTDNTGAVAYGGSALLVVRGEFEDLLQWALPPELRVAIRQARYFDTAVGDVVPEVLVSRNHYAVTQGVDHQGRARSGVLAQAWRPGRASPAEIAAFEHFASNDSVDMLRVASIERYGNGEVPRDARVHYHGDDSRLGPMMKYTRLEPRGLIAQSSR